MGRLHRTREHWLEAALNILEREGEQAVQITRLARELRVARSGFYWHFGDRSELLDAIIAFWEREYTTIVVRQLDADELLPRERLLAIADVVVANELSRFDPSMLAWARRDAAIGRRVAKSFRVRERYVRNAFKELGFKGNDLEARTHSFVSAISTEQIMFRHGTKREARKIAVTIAEILVKR
jgi:AcrR family transcriptional regulator